MTSDDDRTGPGLRGRLARRLFGSATVVVRRWAWSSLVVWIALTVLAVVAYLVHRRGGYGRLGAALDSVLVSIAEVFGVDDTTTAPRTLVGGVQHALIHRLTRGAVARRRGAPTLDSAAPPASEAGPTPPKD
ncbi:hypothetical protein [Mycobacterium sp. MUNTM1]